MVLPDVSLTPQTSSWCHLWYTFGTACTLDAFLDSIHIGIKGQGVMEPETCLLLLTNQDQAYSKLTFQ